MNPIRSALALSIAIAFPAALAQSRGPEADESLLRNTSRVEMYGIFDVGLERVSNGDDAGGTRVSSGMAAGTRLGFRGTEILGEGYRALFVLEARVEADTGRVNNGPAVFTCSTKAGVLCPLVKLTIPAAALLPPANQAAVLGGASLVNATLLQAVTSVNSAGALFDRQAFAGLVTPVGAVILGRQYTPGYEIMNRYTAFADATAGQIGQGYSALAIRANNALQYRAEVGGFGGSLMLGFGGTDANRNERTDIPAGDDFLGVNLFYNAPAFGFGIGYNRNNTVTYAQPTYKQVGLKTLNLGGRVNVGDFKLFAHYMTRKNEHPVLTPEDVQNIVLSSGGNLTTITNTLGALYLNAFDIDMIRGVPGRTDTKLTHLGAIWTIGAGDVYFAWNHAKEKANDAWDVEDAKVNHFALAYFHNLSKRTQLYAVAATARNKGDARMALGAAGYSGGFTAKPGETSNAFQLGMRHAF